jgi:hypothetical protein
MKLSLNRFEDMPSSSFGVVVGCRYHDDLLWLYTQFAVNSHISYTPEDTQLRTQHSNRQLSR